jgi:hypothetical protein
LSDSTFVLKVVVAKREEGHGFALFLILSCSQTGDDPQADLAKFGYRPHMKADF